mgnify:CR=1 FL=1
MAKEISSGKQLSGRYSEVIAILNRIQGKTVPDYQGLKSFWLCHQTFLTAELYGQQMIAPGANDVLENSSTESSANADCCGSSKASKDSDGCWPSGGGRAVHSDNKDTSRSEQSGLIKGLRGQYPFDHSVFPPLLWNATRRATATEISTIAAWIDDGCPDDSDTESLNKPSISVSANKLLALSCGDKKHRVSENCTNISQKEQKGLKVRKEISSLTETEIARLRHAIACMQTYNEHWQDERSFDFWARIHASSCQHGWEQFLPWHRLYLYFFEQMLQDFDEHITLPYWAWSDYADVNRNTFNTNKFDLGVLPDQYGCWINSEGFSNLAGTGLFNSKQLSGLEKLSKSKQIFNSSARFLKAAGIEYAVELDSNTQGAKWTAVIAAIYAELRRINPLWFSNRWPGALGSPTSYPTTQDINLLLQTANWGDFGGGPEYDHHFGYLEQVHNGMHNFSGGTNPNYPRKGNNKWIKIYQTLGIDSPDSQNIENPPFGWMVDNRITAFDPLFWAHHSNVDRIWACWQATHSNGVPEVLDGVLAPWSLTVKDALSTRKLGYEYMRNSYHYKTSSQHGMMKFNSELAGVSSTTLDTFSKVEIRLHRVQNANLPNACIRIFLNDEKVDERSKMDDNDHFVKEIHTFHGSCYGGPGHCNLPLDKSRSSDQRPIQHNEPRNFRINATDAVNRMLAKGAVDISVHLVVVGLDGNPIDDALYLDGVSLNFMD